MTYMYHELWEWARQRDYLWVMRGSYKISTTYAIKQKTAIHHLWRWGNNWHKRENRCCWRFVECEYEIMLVPISCLFSWPHKLQGSHSPHKQMYGILHVYVCVCVCCVIWGAPKTPSSSCLAILLLLFTLLPLLSIHVCQLVEPWSPCSKIIKVLLVVISS